MALVSPPEIAPASSKRKESGALYSKCTYIVKRAPGWGVVLNLISNTLTKHRTQDAGHQMDISRVILQFRAI